MSTRVDIDVRVGPRRPDPDEASGPHRGRRRRRRARPLGSLSPSRAGDFMTCPLLYRFRTIDRLPEPPSPDAVRGTVVHKVLEDLFDLPAAERTPERAADMLRPRLGGAARGRARARRDVRRGHRGAAAIGDLAGARCRVGARPLLHAGGPPAPRARRARALRRDPARRPSCCSAASSTASTSPPTARSGSSTTRPGAPRRALRGQGAVPDEVLRAGHLAHPRRAPERCCSWSTSATPRCCATTPTSSDLLATERKVEAVWQAIQRGARDRRLAARTEPAVRLVRPPGDLPGVRRHAATAPASRGASGRRARHRSEPVGAPASLLRLRVEARRPPRRRRRGAAAGPRPRGTARVTPSPSSLDRVHAGPQAARPGSPAYLVEHLGEGRPASRARRPERGVTVLAGASSWSRSPTRLRSASYSSATPVRIQCSSRARAGRATPSRISTSPRGSAGGTRSPSGGSAASGISPRGRSRGTGRSGSGSGIAASSAFVYGCRGLAKISVGRPDLDDPAEVHDRDPVAEELRAGQVVGDVDVGELRARSLRSSISCRILARTLHVEHRDRLVGHQHARAQDDRAGDHDPLLLAARQVARVLGQEQLDRREADPLERLDDLRAPLARPTSCRARAAASPTASSTVMDGVERGVRVLEDHLDVAAGSRAARRRAHASAMSCVLEEDRARRSRAPGRAARGPASTCRCRSRRPARRPRRGRSVRLTPSTALTVPVSRPNSRASVPPRRSKCTDRSRDVDRSGRPRWRGRRAQASSATVSSSCSSGCGPARRDLVLRARQPALDATAAGRRSMSTGFLRRRRPSSPPGSGGGSGSPSGGSTRSGGAPGMKLSPVVRQRIVERSSSRV